HGGELGGALHGRIEADKGAALNGHVDAAVKFSLALGAHDVLGSLYGGFAVVGEVEGSEGIPHAAKAQSGAAALAAGSAQQLPSFTLHALHRIRLGVVVALHQDALHGLQLQVHQIIHQALGFIGHLGQALVVEAGLGSEGVGYKGEEVDGDQAAAIAALHGDLAAGVGAFVLEAGVDRRGGVLVLPVPEDDARLGAVVGAADQRVPQLSGPHALGHLRFLAINGPAVRVL